MNLTQEILSRFLSKINKTNGCWFWSGAVTSRGYGSFRIHKGKSESSHRIAYFVKYGCFEKSLHVLHKCDNKICVNPQHLFLGTHYDNMADKMNKGRGNNRFGFSHPKARLTNEEVLKIRLEHSKSKALNKNILLAEKYFCSVSNIEKIVYKKNWKHL